MNGGRQAAVPVTVSCLHAQFRFLALGAAAAAHNITLSRNRDALSAFAVPTVRSRHQQKYVGSLAAVATSKVTMVATVTSQKAFLGTGLQTQQPK